MLVPFYRSAVRQFDARIRAVGADQWTSSTPDGEWDVQRLVDYLGSRDDVDPRRIGLLGISKGGIETYLAAASDPRRDGQAAGF